MRKPFERILVANRGEIACRVIRTVHALGRKAIAVYSSADAGAPHVRLADAAVEIGPPPASESYLNIERIIEAARRSGADAVHPGYGFLAENPALARACDEAGLLFIGPPADAIELMGSKAAAKKRVEAAGVPCVPGYHGEDQSDQAFLEAARRIGFPVMIKAAAGGGGRGMRLVEAESELKAALELARNEAESAFGSGELILEKAIVRPRHVEIQVFADDFGNVVHLGERDCSVQRRHQKIIEESPCPVMTEELRSAMGEAAVEAARAIGYRSAGTVEFLLDEERRFYFLEMNTRLQVEHPVTEMVTGLDLVAMQFEVAEGRPLGIRQEDVRLRGHAIEARLYAEDPARGFLPSSGRIELWVPPAGEGIRVDGGIETGSEVSPFYDPLLAKVIAWGETRETARRRLAAALGRTAAFGVTTNRDFLLQALSCKPFVRGEATTALVAEELAQAPPAAVEDGVAAAALQYVLEARRALASSAYVSPVLLNWSSAGHLVSRFDYDLGGEVADFSVSPRGKHDYAVSCGERSWQVRVVEVGDQRARLLVDGQATEAVYFAPAPGRLYLATPRRTHLYVNRRTLAPGEQEAAGEGRVTAPMHGLLVEVSVAEGSRVAKGQRLAVLEAMKMQHEICADVAGIVRAVHCAAGQQVAADDLLFEIEAGEAAGA
ncbi:MAG: acetyl-CoA carboxylase biotin carboxylase subunit [Candidatus Dadabacteria bacterium]|nr:MAG: acetyl-CoA carboxylase biotin carboxylase subunit [Candidatus Dadabacteria bacterium]